MAPEVTRQWCNDARSLLGLGVQEQIDAGAAVSRADEASREIEAARGKDFVKLRALHLDWNDALAQSRAELDRFIERAVSHPEVVYHPSSEELIKKTRELHRELPSFDGSLERALERVAKGEDGALEQARKTAAVAADAYLSELAGKTFLKELDNSFAGKTSVHAAMVRGLTGIKKILTSATP